MTTSTARIGVDIASVGRVAALLARRPAFAERSFTVRERADCARSPQRWASRWAAKEAVRKLHGSAGLALPAFSDIEVVIEPGGAPLLWLRGVRTGLLLSLSHEGDLAVAVAAGDPFDQLLAEPPPGMVLADRPKDAHKGTFGTAVVVGGSVGFSGAPLMSAMAAARGGAGMTRLCVPEPIYTAVASQALEVMVHPLPSSGGGIAPGALAGLREHHLAGADALVLGPGMGRAPSTETLFSGLLECLTCPTVVDADGLNIAAARGLDWRHAGQPVVVTPHPAEMGRLSGLSTAEVQGRRVDVATDYARHREVVVVLKGSETIVAAPDGRTSISRLSTVALASGGSGDVLSGLLAALLAQGLDPFDAAVAAVFVHGEAGMALERRRGRAGVLSRDVLDELPAAQERARVALDLRRRPS